VGGQHGAEKVRRKDAEDARTHVQIVAKSQRLEAVGVITLRGTVVLSCLWPVAAVTVSCCDAAGLRSPRVSLPPHPPPLSPGTR
jgi:hypothetical protein